ncbi:MAG: corrinoid protein [Gammaproteobacteria bacterium]|nr:corrinoid protein [Gammaproteobacteria bacterium]
MTKQYFKRLSDAMITGDEEEAEACVNDAIGAGVDPIMLINKGIQPGMDELGEKFETGEVFLVELILAGDAAKIALNVILPHLSDEDSRSAIKGTVVTATMFGDNHDIGKNLVSAMLSTYGFNVVDAGISAPVREIIEKAESVGADIIAASTLITTSFPYQRQIIRFLNDSGLREKYFVIVGGGPVTPAWTEEIGADGYGRDANDAVTLCQHLMEGDSLPGSLSEPVIIGALGKQLIGR